MKSKTKNPIARVNNPKLNELLNRFDKTAQVYGREADQGDTDSANKAKLAYLRARSRLINALNLVVDDLTTVTNRTKIDR